MNRQRRNMIGLAIGVAMTLAGAIGYVINAPDAGQGGGEWAAAVPSAVIAPAQYFPGTQLSYSGQGVWSVPIQAAPGAYMVAAGRGDMGCTWKRLSSDDGKPKHEIDSATLNPGGFSAEVTIASTDKYFQLIGDCKIARVKP